MSIIIFHLFIDRNSKSIFIMIEDKNKCTKVAIISYKNDISHCYLKLLSLSDDNLVPFYVFLLLFSTSFIVSDLAISFFAFSFILLIRLCPYYFSLCPYYIMLFRQSWRSA